MLLQINLLCDIQCHTEIWLASYKDTRMMRSDISHLIQWRIHASINETNISSDNELSPIRHQAIILTDADPLSVGPLGTNFKSKYDDFRWEIRVKILSLQLRSVCFGLNVSIVTGDINEDSMHAANNKKASGKGCQNCGKSLANMWHRFCKASISSRSLSAVHNEYIYIYI